MSNNPGSCLVKFDPSVSSTKELLHPAGPLKLKELIIENNDAAVLFLHLWDAATTGAASGAADRTILVPASGVLPLHPSSQLVHYFGKGCVYATSSARASLSAPSTASCVTFTYEA